MRVAILSLHDFEEVKGGVEIFVNNLQRAFPGCEKFNFSNCRDLTSVPDLTKINLEFERKGLAVSRGFARRHREEPFDLAICNDLSGIGLKLLAPQVPACQIFHYTYRGFSKGALRGQKGYSSSYYIQPMFEKLTASGKRLVAVSDKLRRELDALYGLKADLIEIGLDLQHFRPFPKQESRERLGIKWQGPLGIFVGRTDSTKGFEILQAVARQRKDIKVLCVTSSDYQDQNMIMARRVPNEQMPLYYSAADFFLFPSYYESASFASVEAMACGLPVVAYKTGLFEDIDERRVGRILTSRDPKDFSEAIDHVLRSSGFDPRRLAEERFSMERFIADYRALAQDLVKVRVAESA